MDLSFVSFANSWYTYPVTQAQKRTQYGVTVLNGFFL